MRESHSLLTRLKLKRDLIGSLDRMSITMWVGSSGLLRNLPSVRQSSSSSSLGFDLRHVCQLTLCSL